MPTTTISTFGKRVQLEKLRGDLSVSVPVTVKSGFIIKQGDVIGKITADGKYRRRSITQTAGTGFGTGSPTGQVVDAGVFAVGDVLKNAAGTTIGTVAAGGINTVANPNTVTLSANAAVAVAAGNNVLGSDGSQVAAAISDHETDGSQDQPIAAMIGGYLDESLLRGLDSTAKTELGGASVAGGVFKF